MVKDGRFSYFADLISSSKCNCKVLFNTINNIASPAPPDVTVILNMDCNNFLSFFADNIKDTGASIAPSSTPLYDNPTQPSILDCFSPTSLQDLIDHGAVWNFPQAL